MALRFLYGPAGLAHEKTLTRQLQQEYHLHPHDHFFYLVPNHIKFQSEIDVINQLNQHPDQPAAQMQIQILSLTRMAWYFLSQTVFPQYQTLSPAGVKMLLTRIIIQHQNDLQLFANEVHQPGFIQKLADEISEMRTGQITAAALKTMLETETSWDVDLKQKMHDFVLIYHLFEQQTQQHYFNKADTLDLLCDYFQKPASQKILAHAHFYLSGFSQFTAQENHLVRILIQKAASVTIDLNLDRPAVVKPKSATLFHQSANLYYYLYKYARENHVPVRPDLAITDQRVSPDLQRLDRFWAKWNQQKGALSTEHLADSKSIQVIRADNRYAEVAKVARLIRQMVATGKYRYRDFLILTRHLDQFQNVLQPIFKAQQIPVFNDVQKTMDTHPLVQLLNALFKIDQPDQIINYRYQDVMTLLKTELLIPKDAHGHYLSHQDFRHALALTENHVLAAGYFSDRYGNHWTQTDDWQVLSQKQAHDFGETPDIDAEATKQVNIIRNFVKKILPPFYQALAKAKTGKQAVRILYRFVVQNGVLDQLKQWQQRDLDPQNPWGSDPEAAGHLQQVWQVFCDLLDDYEQILGKTPFNNRHFWDVLQAGFAGSVYAQVPSTLDQVIISESKIVQTTHYKVVFMIGSTDDVMPDHLVNDHFFNDDDLQMMQPYFNDSRYLNDNSVNQMAGEPYLNYLAFMSATQQVIFTYSLKQDDNNETARKISPYVAAIQKHFQIVPQIVRAQPQADNPDVLPYVGTVTTTRRHFVQAANDSRSNQRKLAPGWLYIYRILKGQFSTQTLLGGLTYNNQPQPLRPQLVTALYGENINSSISQLEKFYDDPYEYFLRYGLKLQPRQIFELTSANTGSFYHEIMDHFIKLVNRNHWDLAHLTAQQINYGVKRIAEGILNDNGQPQYQILISSHRMDFIYHRILRMIQRVLFTLRKQSLYTPMRPRQTEVSFGLPGPGIKLAPLAFKIESHHHYHQIRVHGRIDRIDRMATASKDYFSVVDYKSSKHSFDYGEIYAGNEMQMMTYLDVLYHNLNRLDERQKGEVAGALYSWLHTPKLKPTDAEQVQAAILKSQSYHQALLVNDQNLLAHIDRSLQPAAQSKVYPLKENKNGSLSKRSTTQHLIKPADLKLILKRTRALIRQAGTQIYQGNIQLTPVQFDHQRTLLDYSPYRSIMEFDPLLPNNNYRNVNSLSLADLIERLRAKER